METLPAGCVSFVDENAETEALRDEYLLARVVGRASTGDAHHVALATFHRVDVIASWNFKHIVQWARIREFAVNLRLGYPIIDIRSPRELVLP